MSDLLKLAERCEAATGPNFRLEQDIWAAAVAAPPANLSALGQIKPPAYTASLDAAMTLVPEGMGYGVAEPRNGVEPSGLIFNQNGLHIEVRAATPALALCAAALHARATQ